MSRAIVVGITLAAIAATVDAQRAELTSPDNARKAQLFPKGTEETPLPEGMKKTKTKEHYYIPVFGSIQADDNEDLRNYRKFIHRPRMSMTP